MDTLDSRSTISVFKEENYVSNNRKSERAIIALTNGGQQKSRNVADTKYFGQVWFHQKSLANILSLADVVKYAKVTMDSSVKKSMFVHREDGCVMEFKQYKTGLYYFDVAERGKRPSTSSDINYHYLPSFSLIQTVQ